MVKAIWPFVVAVLKHWWALLSCAGFTALGVWVEKYNISGQGAVSASYALAIVFIFVAMFLAWFDVHRRLEEEIQRNLKADIRGRAFGFVQEGQKLDGVNTVSGSDYAPIHCSAHFRFRVELANHNHAETNLIKIVMDGSGMTPVASFPQPSVQVHPSALKRGFREEVSFSQIAEVDGMSLEDVGTLSLNGLKVNVIDGFGDSHSLAVEKGERIVFSKKGGK